jgi:hypothetical protein
MSEAMPKSAKVAGAARTQVRTEHRGTPGGGAASPLGILQAQAGNRAVSSALGGGQPLPEALRKDMESRFGETFFDVRIHDGADAHASAASLHAKAYTHGHDIVFGAGRFSPTAGPGRRLLAHELAHVVQQRRGGAAPPLDANAAHERSADAAADAAASGRGNVAVGGATGVGVARDAEEGWGAGLRRKYREEVQNGVDFLSEKAQEGLGSAKGVVTQVTEVADTAMWLGTEYRDLRDKAATAIGGKEGSIGNKIVRNTLDLGAGALPYLADASDEAKKAGLVDPESETKQASLTAPMSAKLNKWADAAEEKLGAKPADPAMFSPMEKAEIASSIGVQIALSATGVEEVKIAMNVIGAASGIRTVVETMRHDPNWISSPRFWGHVIGLGLSLVGLRHAKAASKFTTLALRYGGILAAVPVLGQLAADYYKLETEPQMQEEERRKVEASVKQDWIAVMHIVKEAILHVAQAQGVKPKGAGAAADEGAASKPPAHAVPDEGAGPKPPAPAAHVDTPVAKSAPAGSVASPPAPAAPKAAKAAKQAKASKPPKANAKPAAPVPVDPAQTGAAAPDPLVAVRIAGGGGKTKNTYYEAGTPMFAKVNGDPRFVVLPKSQAELVWRARPAGTPPRTDIQPTFRNGVQMESAAAGGGKANQHAIVARADTPDNPKAAAAVFGKTIRATGDEAQGYKFLIGDGEYGIQRPGNVSTGGVDAITARLTAKGESATVFLNDFTTPGTGKGSKPTHANWVAELGEAIKDKRFGFGKVETDRAILTAITHGKVHVRTVRVGTGPDGPTVSPDRKSTSVPVPAAVRKAAAAALARLPAPGATP